MSSRQRPYVLVVEDDPSVASGIVRGLNAAGFDAELHIDGESARRAVSRTTFDAVVLDLMLPALDGLEVLEHIRAVSSIPVIVLSARSSLESRLDSFARGAVDFIPKPFWSDELIARLRLRVGVSVAAQVPRVLEQGPLKIDLEAREVYLHGEVVALTKAELNLLVFLVERAGRAISRRDLSRALPGLDADYRTIDSHLVRVRRKLGGVGESIETVWGIGYRFRIQSGIEEP